MENIRAAQIFDDGTVECFDRHGKKTLIKHETSVKAFVETELKHGRIDDTTKIYLPTGKIAEVHVLKKELKIGSWWSRLFRR